MVSYSISKDRLDAFLAELSTGRQVFALEKADSQYHLVNAPTWKPGVHTLGDFRPIEGLKSLVFKPRESLGALSADPLPPVLADRIVIGVKNCDLSSLEIQDYVFLSEPIDPYYKQARDKTVIVSCDCTDCKEVCFCPVVGEQPWAKKGFDVNISPITSGYIIESGSPKGEEMLKISGNYLSTANKQLLDERDERRKSLYNKVAGQALKLKGLQTGLDLQKAIKNSENSDLWDDFSKDCVECGACNFSCCTCHCFLLADGLDVSKNATRIKQWDACLYLNFARVAGGHNPRKHRAERLYNRFDKKFNFFPNVLKTYACDGCGRCAEACTGNIDIRDVLKRATDEAKSL